MKRLHQVLREIDGRPYGAWSRISGRHSGAGFILGIDHVQRDVFAPPSRLSIHVPLADHPVLAAAAESGAEGRLALEDLALRAFARGLPEESRPGGDGPGGRLTTVRPGPQILPRSAAQITPTHLVLRFTLALPAERRMILAEPAADVLLHRLPALVVGLLRGLDEAAWKRHLAELQRTRALRAALGSHGLAAFVEDGSLLARTREGRSLPGAKPFRVPDELAVEIEIARGAGVERVRGLAIPEGVTVLVGGAFQGKTTLLEALGEGVYDHVASDGRAGVVALSDACRVRIEEDRVVRPVDLSPFFHALPGADAARFATDAASGSTSQAAALVEALQAGCRVLLIDEDASAANFLTRDALIASLLPGGGETVVPLAHRVREMRASLGVSFVVIAGASSEWLALADRVIALDAFQPCDATGAAQRAVALAGLSIPSEAEPALWSELLADAPLLPADQLPGEDDLGDAVRLRVQSGHVRVSDAIAADCSGLVQAVCPEQLRAAAVLVGIYLRQCRADGVAPTREGLRALWENRRDQGIGLWARPPVHDLALPRFQEVFAFWQRVELAGVPRDGHHSGRPVGTETP